MRLGQTQDCGAYRISRMDRLGPSTAFQVRWATRRQGRTHGDQRTWWQGLRIADRRKTSMFRLLIQVTSFLISKEERVPRAIIGSDQCILDSLGFFSEA